MKSNVILFPQSPDNENRTIFTIKSVVMLWESQNTVVAFTGSCEKKKHFEIQRAERSGTKEMLKCLKQSCVVVMRKTQCQLPRHYLFLRGFNFSVAGRKYNSLNLHLLYYIPDSYQTLFLVGGKPSISLMFKLIMNSKHLLRY